MKNRTILQGDALEKLQEISNESIDCIVTDPPYGYSFMCKAWDKAVIGVDTWKECLRVLKPGAFACIMSAPRQDVMGRMIVNLTDAGFVTSFTPIFWAYPTGFPKATNIAKMVDKKLGFEREVIGVNEEFKKKNSASVKAGQSSMNKSLQIKGATSTEAGFQHPETIGDITKPSSPQAKKLDGSYAGFQPKPAVEVILVCMKPLSEKNYIEQAMSTGKGITWLDDCRIPFVNKKDIEGTKVGHKGTPLSPKTGWNENNMVTLPFNPPSGRFPANLLVSDDTLNDGKIRQGHSSGKTKHGFRSDGYIGNGEYYDDIIERGILDSGSFSRYFDLDAWEKQHLSQFIITPKASKSEKNKGLDNFTMHKVNDGRKIDADNAFQRGATERKNTHPTVKPVSLFSYLITMVSRENDLVLDPFLGSGTCGISAEMLSRNWIGIELDETYVDIANARLDRFLKQQKLEEFC